MTNKAKIITEIQDRRMIMLSLRCRAKSEELTERYYRIAIRLQYYSEEIAEKLDVCPLCGETRDNFELIDEGYSEMYDTCPECRYSEYSHSDLDDPYDI